MSLPAFQVAVTTLFKVSFAPIDVTELRVHRARVALGSLEGLITAGLIGASPTTIWLTLADGRRFTHRSRGSGTDHQAVELVVATLREQKLRAARAQLALGERVSFGDVSIGPTGLEVKGRAYAFEDIVGHRLRAGWWMFDTSQGLAEELAPGTLPWGDVFVALVFDKVGDRDYARQSPAAWPSFGFLRLSAATRVPGTWRYQLHALVGLVALSLVGGALFGVGSFLRRAAREDDARQRRLERDRGFEQAREAILAGATLPECPPVTKGVLNRVIDVGRQHPVELMVASYPSTVADVLSGGGEFYVWGVHDGEVRVVRWDRTVSCLSRAPAGAEPAETAFSLIKYGVKATLAREPPPPPPPLPPEPPATFDTLLAAQAEAVAARPWAVGDGVQVTWKGQPWAATIIKVFSQKKVRVHYDGWDKAWDETIPVTRIVGRR